jgi:hypothetical protein
LFVLGSVFAVCAVVPFAVALGVLRHPRWYPILDIAQVELRVRDVGTPDRPLVGLLGRIYGHGIRGSHPGPIGFWVLWPFYRLYGGTAWALQAATATCNAFAVGTVLWLFQRRTGTYGVLGAGVALALLMRAYGFDKLTIPWNPYLPLLWWVVFLVAVWSVLCDDLVVGLPVAVFAGSFCAQTHVSYVGLVGVVGVMVVVMLSRRVDLSRRVAGVVAASAGLLLLLWLPPLLDQSSGHPGNLDVIRDAFTHPIEPPLGLGVHTVRTWLAYLDPWGLLRPYPTTGHVLDGSPVPGVVTLLAWLGSVVVAARLRRRDLIDLHIVVATALPAGLISISRIFGPVWYWLTLWSWGTLTLLVVATGWTLASCDLAILRIRERRPAGAIVACCGAVAAGLLLTFNAAHADPSPDEVRESAILRHVAPLTVRALRGSGGQHGRYLVRFDEDPFYVGAIGQGLVLELERQGFDVGVAERSGPELTHHRVRRPEDAAAIITQVAGPAAIERWRARPTATLVALYDPRSPTERHRFQRSYRHLAQDLERLGHGKVTTEASLVAITFAGDLPPNVRSEAATILEMPHPVAIFIEPANL